MNNLQYITFNQLMASVESDISSISDNGLVNRGTCIKVARKVNNDLGLKIYREREATIKIENYKADLPEDFLYLQLALICGKPQEFNMPTGTIWGTHTEEKKKEEVVLSCKNPEKACLNSCNGTYWVTQTFKEKTVKVQDLRPIRLTKRSLKFCGDVCINNNWSGAYELDIKDGEVVANFCDGEIYINYIADMVDKDNNILILDHPMLTPYYEYAMKKHIFENMMLNGDQDVQSRLGYLRDELREARIAALNFVNTVEYTDIQDTFQANRKLFYNKYFRMFDC